MSARAPKDEAAVSASNEESLEGISSSGEPSAEHAPDDLNRLLVLSKDTSSIKSTVSFLNRRGIETFASQSLQDVIDRLSKGWCRYLLFSINYPHPKVDMVPQLLAQSFGAEVMVFAESGDRKTNARLTGTRAKQTIFGAPSGPIVLMRLRQMQRELNGGSEESTGQSSAEGQGSGGADNDVRISGSDGGDGNAIHLRGEKKGEPKKSGEALSRLMSALKEDSSESSAPSLDQLDLDEIRAAASKKAKKPGVIIQKGKKAQAAQLVLPPPSKKQKEAVRKAMNAGALTPGLPEEGTPGKMKSAMQEGHGEAAKKSAMQEGHGEAAKKSAMQEGHGEAAKKSAMQEGHGEAAKKSAVQPGAVGSVQRDGNTLGASSGVAVSAQNESEIAAVEATPAKDPTLTPIQILERCARSALTRCCGKPREQKDVLLEYRTSSVLVITTKEITGSILIAVGSGKFDDKEMLKKVEIELIDQLTNSGVEVGIGQLEAFPVSPASSIEEAFIHADFTAVSRSEHSEVGIAFLTITPVQPDYQETHDDMVQVTVDSIEPEVKIAFEVFLYLPANQKYLRYLKEGSAISFKQSDRLKKYEVAAFYLKKGDKEAFRQHATVANFKKQVAKKAS